MGIIGRSPGGRPLRRRREMVLMSAHRGCEGPQPSRPPPNPRCHGRMGIIGRSPGGRPLRRRREMMSNLRPQRLRGTASPSLNRSSNVPMACQECVHSESEGGSMAGTVSSRSTCFAALVLSSYRTITANSSAQNACSSSIERLLPIVIA